MAEDGALGNSRQEMVERFTRIPGLGRSRAESIYDAGYTNVGLLRKAPVEELTKIPGVGMSLARCVKQNLDRVQDESPAAVSVASAAQAPGEPEKIVVGASATSPQKPEAPAPAAANAAPGGAFDPRPKAAILVTCNNCDSQRSRAARRMVVRARCSPACRASCVSSGARCAGTGKPN